MTLRVTRVRGLLARAKVPAALMLVLGAGTFGVPGALHEASAAGGSGAPGYCTDATGVTVVVDFQELGGGVVVRCFPHPTSSSTGVDALEGAGFTPEGTARFGLGFVCRIQGKPSAADEKCIDTPPATDYWSYWYAANGGSWKYSDLGVTSHKVILGGFEGWSFSYHRTATTSPPPRVAPLHPVVGPAPDPTPKPSVRPTPPSSAKPTSGTSPGAGATATVAAAPAPGAPSAGSSIGATATESGPPDSSPGPQALRRPEAVLLRGRRSASTSRPRSPPAARPGRPSPAVYSCWPP